MSAVVNPGLICLALDDAYRRAGAGWEEVSAPGLYRPEAVPVAPGRDWTGCGDGFAAYRERLAARLGECVAAIRPEATQIRAAWPNNHSMFGSDSSACRTHRP